MGACKNLLAIILAAEATSGMLTRSNRPRRTSVGVKKDALTRTIADTAVTPSKNWSSPDEPCARYKDLTKYDLGDIGVKIDASDPSWTVAFRQALGFWNTVIDVHLHEEDDLKACAIRIVDDSHHRILTRGHLANSQYPKWRDFEGKIAVRPSTLLTDRERVATAAHELGHLFGIFGHNPAKDSLMCAYGFDGTQVLDERDLAALGEHHQLREAAVRRMNRDHEIELFRQRRQTYRNKTRFTTVSSPNRSTRCAQAASSR